MPDRHVRLAEPQDRQAVLEICLKTADSGRDATGRYSDPDYPGLVWAVPYLDFEPAHCFVLDEDGVAVGFVVGAADTVAYEEKLARSWWPALRARYAGREALAPSDQRVLDYIREPESSDALAARYPAHLHINLLPHVQSGGWGRKLIEAELDSLRQAGASGVFLGVGSTNARAIGFYEHVGFEPIDGPGDAIWYAMRLQAG